jgi:hypothetical protein
MLSMLLSMTLLQMPAVDPVATAVSDSKGRPDAAVERYVYFGGVPKDKQAKLFQAINRHVNALSTEPVLKKLEPVAPGVARLNFRDYGKSFELAWDKQRDPYFGAHVAVSDTVPVVPSFSIRETPATGKGKLQLVEGKGSLQGAEGTVWTIEQAGKYTLKVGTLSKELTLAASVNYIVSVVVPAVVAKEKNVALLVNALWFLNQTAADEDGRSPSYRDFLGVKNQKDFETLIGLNREILKTYFKLAREAVAKSGVARQPRELEFLGIPGGWLSLTKDNRLALGNRNPLETQGVEFDATEGIAPLANGLLAYLLANRQGELQRAAPDFVGPNTEAPGDAHDGRIHNYIGCIQCHKTGLQDVPGFYRSVFSKVKYYNADPDKHQEVTRAYFSDLEPIINQTRQTYASAIMKVTTIDADEARILGLEATPGMKPEDDSANMSDTFWGYEKAQVTRVYAATAFGCNEATLVNAIQQRYKAEKIVNPMLLNWLGPDLPITIRQFESLYKEGRETVQRYGKL